MSEKKLFNFDYEGNNIYSNIEFTKKFFEENFTIKPDKIKERIDIMVKELSELIKEAENGRICDSGMFLFLYKKENDYFVIDIYEPNNNALFLNNMLSVIGHETMFLIDTNNKTYKKTYTR